MTIWSECSTCSKATHSVIAMWLCAAERNFGGRGWLRYIPVAWLSCISGVQGRREGVVAQGQGEGVGVGVVVQGAVQTHEVGEGVFVQVHGLSVFVQSGDVGKGVVQDLCTEDALKVLQEGPRVSYWMLARASVHPVMARLL